MEKTDKIISGRNWAYNISTEEKNDYKAFDMQWFDIARLSALPISDLFFFDSEEGVNISNYLYLSDLRSVGSF